MDRIDLLRERGIACLQLASLCLILVCLRLTPRYDWAALAAFAPLLPMWQGAVLLYQDYYRPALAGLVVAWCGCCAVLGFALYAAAGPLVIGAALLATLATAAAGSVGWQIVRMA